MGTNTVSRSRFHSLVLAAVMAAGALTAGCKDGQVSFNAVKANPGSSGDATGQAIELPKNSGSTGSGDSTTGGTIVVGGGGENSGTSMPPSTGSGSGMNGGATTGENGATTGAATTGGGGSTTGGSGSGSGSGGSTTGGATTGGGGSTTGGGGDDDDDGDDSKGSCSHKLCVNYEVSNISIRVFSGKKGFQDRVVASHAEGKVYDLLHLEEVAAKIQLNAGEKVTHISFKGVAGSKKNRVYQDHKLVCDPYSVVQDSMDGPFAPAFVVPKEGKYRILIEMKDEALDKLLRDCKVAGAEVLRPRAERLD